MVAFQWVLAEWERFWNHLPCVLDGTCSGSSRLPRLWDELPSVHPCLPVYLLGFFLLQLANTKSVWLRMGGRPRA